MPEAKLRILGVDPGLARLGYAVIEATGDTLRLVGAGLVTTAARACRASRLHEIAEGFETVLDDFDPTEAAIERLTFTRNVSSALPVSEVVGVVRLALWRRGVVAYDISPNTVKNAATSGGSAAKEQVQRTVVRLLGLDEPPQPPDVADAMAIAYTRLAQRRWER